MTTPDPQLGGVPALDRQPDPPETSTSARTGLCLATATSDSFIPGTLVLIHSFLKHNRWFDGDIVVFHRDLSAESLAYLTAFEQVVFCECSNDLAQRMKLIVEVRPEMNRIIDRLLSLEAFRLDAYERVVFLDSDTLVAAPIQDLFTASASLAACGDGAFYQGEPTSFGSAGRIAGAFNAGALSIDRALRTGDDYAALLRLASPELFSDRSLCFTDQAVLNLHFGGRYERLGPELNYLLAFRQAVQARDGLRVHDARVIHFNGPDKPWSAEGAVRGSERDPAFAFACAAWLQRYGECLARLSLLRVRLEPALLPTEECV